MTAEAALEAAEASDIMGDTADIVAAVTKVRFSFFGRRSPVGVGMYGVLGKLP